MESSQKNNKFRQIVQRSLQESQPITVKTLGIELELPYDVCRKLLMEVGMKCKQLEIQQQTFWPVYVLSQQNSSQIQESMFELSIEEQFDIKKLDSLAAIVPTSIPSIDIKNKIAEIEQKIAALNVIQENAQVEFEIQQPRLYIPPLTLLAQKEIQQLKKSQLLPEDFDPYQENFDQYPKKFIFKQKVQKLETGKRKAEEVKFESKKINITQKQTENIIPITESQIMQKQDQAPKQFQPVQKAAKKQITGQRNLNNFFKKK